MLKVVDQGEKEINWFRDKIKKTPSRCELTAFSLISGVVHERRVWTAAVSAARHARPVLQNLDVAVSSCWVSTIVIRVFCMTDAVKD